jgi:hypothetical protein
VATLLLGAQRDLRLTVPAADFDVEEGKPLAASRGRLTTHVNSKGKLF